MTRAMPDGIKTRSSRYPEHRNEIGNEIDWAEGVGDNERTQ